MDAILLFYIFNIKMRLKRERDVFPSCRMGDVVFRFFS